jgi:ferredoxin
MAKPTLRLPENAPGSFYVDESCIDCDRCRSDAPAFFHRNDSIGLTVVYRQPASPEEIALAEEALAGCPTDSIGREGVFTN